MLLKGRTPIKPTEEPESVLRCIFNLFPDCNHQITEGMIEFSTDEVGKFIEILYEQHIRDTAIMVMEKALDDDTTTFYLNKQAAYMEEVNFTDGDSTLGDLKITIVEGTRQLIEAITPYLD